VDGRRLVRIPRTRFVLIAFALLVVTLLVWQSRSIAAFTPAEKSIPESEAILKRASDMERLRTDATEAFEMRAAIKLYVGKRTVDGEYMLDWSGPDHWQETLTLAKFQRVRTGVAGGYWQTRSMDYQPQEVFDVDRLFDVPAILRLAPGEVARKTQKRKINKLDMSCVEVYLNGYLTRELCFDPGSGLLLHAEMAPLGTPFEAPYIVDYSGKVDFAGRTVPSVARFTRTDQNAVEIAITQLSAASTRNAPAQGAAPKAEFWASCEDAPPATISHYVTPRYPDGAASLHIVGVVSFYATIEPDGSVSHLTTLDTPSKMLEESARDAVQKWKYTAPLCGSTPARTESLIEVAFNQYR
jgi:TonB family protein